MNKVNNNDQDVHLKEILGFEQKPFNFISLRRGFLQIVLFMMTASAYSHQELTALQRENIDGVVADVMSKTGTPSASIAIVMDGKIAYKKAYGLAHISPDKNATIKMRYAIASNSKQFIATAILLLVEEGKLSLDDKVSKWFPALTRAKEISIRQLLSMTAGYQDYWPQDFVPISMLKPVKSNEILKKWAGKALDFEPGSKYQYSNTNYIIAGLIIEEVSGMKLFDFLKKRIFIPLGMNTVVNFDEGPLGKEDVSGYLRNALGPLRTAPKEGQGWLFAAGGLAMTPHDLALWNISMINETILKPTSYKTMQSHTLLADGTNSDYGLGIAISKFKGHRLLSHGGAASGYLTANDVYPDKGVAIVVFTNIFPGAAGPHNQITNRIAKEIFESPDSDTIKALEKMKKIFSELQNGKMNRELLTENAKAYFSKQVVSDFASSLGQLGEPDEFKQTNQSLRGGMITRVFLIKAGLKTIELVTRTYSEGKIEQFTVEQLE